MPHLLLLVWLRHFLAVLLCDALAVGLGGPVALDNVQAGLLRNLN